MSVAAFDGRASVAQIIEHLEQHQVHSLTCRSVLDDDSIITFHDAVIGNTRLVASLHTLKLPASNLSSCSLPFIARILLSARSLQHVDLSENQLGDSCNSNGLEQLIDVLIDTEYSSCQIRSLNLQHNKIGPKGSHALSRLLRQNCTLESLSLAQNALGTKTIKAIAPSIAQNQTLKHLDLSYNKLSDRGITTLACIFDEKSSSRLVSLDLQYNKIGPAGAYVLAKALLACNNKHLTDLNLSLNCIGPDGAQALGAVLKYSHVLEQVYLGRNDMSLGVLPLLQGLADSQVTRLRLLDLSWNSLTDDAVVYLADHVMPKNIHLQVLNLASNAISDRGILALSKALVEDLGLRELDIVGNQARDSSAFALADLLTTPQCYLQTLKWEKNNFTKAGRMRLQAALAYRDNLEQWLGIYLDEMRTRKVMAMDFSSRRIGDDELIAMCRALAKQKPRVPTFWLHGNAREGNCAAIDSDDDEQSIQSITSRGVAVLADEVLAKNAGLVERLYFDECASIGDDGWSFLARALVTNKTIVVLSLTGSNVSSDAAMSIASALGRNNKLERLNLSDNKLGDAFLRALTDSIQELRGITSLKSLNLSRNGISDLGMASFPSLGADCTLLELHLAGNDITDAGALDLAKACIHNVSFEWVNLSRNRLSYRGKRAVKLFLTEGAVVEADEQRT